MQPQSTIPVGFCQCGCGQRTSVARQTSHKHGYVKGEPVRYVLGHRPHRRQNPVELFWSKVRKSPEPDGCWLWTAGRNNKGYGLIRWRGRNCLAHRISWELANGPFPAELQVLHRCDVPLCIRPDHLFLGTVRDNVRDMMAKGRNRARAGESAAHSKLTGNQVRELRARFACGETNYSQLARAYGIDRGNVRKIVLGINWRHLL